MLKEAFWRISLLLSLLSPHLCLAFSEGRIAEGFAVAGGLPVGERIGFWAEMFVGTPYDTDPAGLYVTRRKIVADDRVDCMYLVFRSVELAISKDPREATEAALTLRFHSKGEVEKGIVTNYQDRFRYGEDMIFSGKWGKEITSDLGRVETIQGSRGMETVEQLSRHEAIRALSLLMSGDIIFFVKVPGKRVEQEIIGHMGIIKRSPAGEVWLIHAGGMKGNHAAGGSVKKVLLRDYLRTMPFIGIMVTRFP
ncbi:MAG: hypothetical protein HGA78_10100 [Nitrospirales bacterium]|nr:hypothetical protein [Nitrospirales bacterium]